MKSFFNDPNAVGGILFALFPILMIVSIWGTVYITANQNYKNYQQALITTSACRLAAKGDADKTCGPIPTTQDFNITTK